MNSNTAESSVKIDPAMKEAIAHEVYQALHDTMPNLLAEALKTIKKDTPRRKEKPVVDDVVSTESDKGDSEAEVVKVVSKGCDYTTFMRCVTP
jgi:hypothetical protein